MKDASQGVGIFPIPKSVILLDQLEMLGSKDTGGMAASQSDLNISYLYCTFCSRSHAQEEDPFSGGSIWYC